MCFYTLLDWREFVFFFCSKSSAGYCFLVKKAIRGSVSCSSNVASEKELRNWLICMHNSYTGRFFKKKIKIKNKKLSGETFCLWPLLLKQPWKRQEERFGSYVGWRRLERTSRLNRLSEVYQHTHSEAARRHLICWDLHLLGVMSPWMWSPLSWTSSSLPGGQPGAIFSSPRGCQMEPVREKSGWAENTPCAAQPAVKATPPPRVQEWSPSRTPAAADTKSRPAGCDYTV